MKNLLRPILERYALSPTGTHGLSHWARVLEIGRILAPLTGANLKVVEHFAILHDSCRQSEFFDSRHGERSAAYVMSLKLDLTKKEHLLLATACKLHNHVERSGPLDITLETCWDSDRLDLARVGSIPDPERLFTTPAREPKFIIERSMEAFVENLPSLVKKEWGMNFKQELEEKEFIRYKKMYFDDFMKRVEKSLMKCK